MPQPNEESLPIVEQTRWFAQEVHVCDSQLRGYLRRSFPSLRDVEDIVQESYLRIWRARLNHHIVSARSFLFQVARHIAIDGIRKNRPIQMEDLRDLGATAVFDEKRVGSDELNYNEMVAIMADALARLPPRCREIFILRKLKHVRQSEIAERLGISSRTVESQITRGMKLCEAHFKRRGIYGFHCNES